MVVIEGEKTIYFDVDDTLVSWIYPDPKTSGRDYKDFKKFTDPVTGNIWDLLPNSKVINCLIDHKERGDTVIVWSQGGALWAESVVKTLGIGEFVDACLSKPHQYYDDIPSSEFMGTRLDYSIKEIK